MTLRFAASAAAASLLVAVVSCGGARGAASSVPPGSGGAPSTGGAAAGTASAASGSSSAATAGHGGDATDAGEGGGAGSASQGGTGGAPHVVGDCSDLPAPGVWQETTPAEVKAGFAQQTYGVIALAVNPQNPAVVYFGSHQLGIWKSGDCGSSWSHVNTGRNGAVLDGGFQWSVAIDPTNPDVLYANSGYSSSNGAWKSTNAGVDWAPLWPPADAQLATAVQYDFVHKIRVDPADHRHLLISFHAECNPPYARACLAESHDEGASWRMVDGDASWVGAEDQTIWFLGDAKSWLYASQSNGLWRTADAGDSWHVVDAGWGAHNGGQLYRTASGVFYLANPAAGVLRSADGETWSAIAGTSTGLIGLTGDGTSLYASRGPYAEDPPYLPYFTAPEADGQSFRQLSSPLLSTGGYELGYDPDHRVLYSTNATAGFYRVVLQ